jgi:uncharacterized membrane protein YeaQ/YmgE (transglycosylase-associated protein family)
MSSLPTSSANDKVINVDLGLNIFGLSLFLVCFVALLLKYKFKIDPAAIVICSLYPIGTISQVVWRVYGDSMNEITRSFVIILHDLVVISPCYFIFEMEKVRVVIQSSGVEDFQRANRIMKRGTTATFVGFIFTSLVGAFMTSIGLQELRASNYTQGRFLYITGSILQALFFVLATALYYIYMRSVTYFVKRKVQKILRRQFDKLTSKQRFLIVWSFLVGALNMLTLVFRIFITYWTRRNLTPEKDTFTPMVEGMMLTITLVDWVTPYTLVFCYYHISR